MTPPPKTFDPAEIRRLDKTHGWHPFTPMGPWIDPSHDPLVLVAGEGPYLFDAEGRRYLDGNSSIWTNIHGHAHPRINAAIRAQLEKIAHVSFLGSTHPPGAILAARLCGFFPPQTLTRCFFSDDGSTAIEAALKMSAQYWEMTGQPQRNRFISFRSAYHGDTRGAASLGDVPLFRGGLGALDFPVARISSLEELIALPDATFGDVAAVVIEPILQGVAGMRPWPRGMLAGLREWTQQKGIHLLLDEVMTAFGRTGKMFACEHEAVIPDFLCLAKGLTGGYLPLAATLTSETIFSAFLGAPSRAFYYGHSYTANPLGCAAALASLEVFEEEKVLDRLTEKILFLTQALKHLTGAREIRQCGFVAGIEVCEGTGMAVCLAARRHGLLTRPIRDTVVLMLPLCVSTGQIDDAVQAIALAMQEIDSQP